MLSHATLDLVVRTAFDLVVRTALDLAWLSLARQYFVCNEIAGTAMLVRYVLQLGV